MIRGLAITPPTLGRISIGSIVEKNGKRLPVKEDYFTITSNVQNKDGWIKHPLNDELIKSAGQDKLRSIPVRLLFSDPDLNLRAEYSMFDRQTGRPLCVGNGETCRRYTETGIQSLPCPSPDLCELAKGGRCKPFGRLNVQIGDDDTLGTFIFRTTGFNSIRTLTARLNYLRAVSGGLLACLPLQLKLRGKSTTMSHRSTIYFVDLTTRDGMSLEASIAAAKDLDKARKEAGFDQLALDRAALDGFANGAFEEDTDEVMAITEEFYSEEEHNTPHQAMIVSNAKSTASTKPSVKEQLMTKASLLSSKATPLSAA
ncbi:hydrolase or metal-binding protein [Undibacterium sp. LX40W]|uniref:Hydrolase or metal-binding protein n=1 Tax=Undibacterium nitidum TaxID=2762298 RepID=A0A923HIX9_9BURK|nr:MULTISPECIES: hydrolase or metal-binding protein [Undibacterium]MBC3880249.1 hydrolase or metal-binding protein [Undibacterium nitidum]MBC3891015.1 hydrolase or metal-binding protein [Undibacterium sp. LX40W]